MIARRGSPALPAFIEPSLAKPVKVPPEGAHWVHEIKHDGYRVQARLAAGRVELLTRSGLDWTARFGAVAGEIAALPAISAVLDGEAIVQDAAGVSSFAGLTRELKHGRPPRIVVMAFDLMFLDGADLRPLPLLERKRRLDHLLRARAPAALLQYSAHTAGDAAAIFATAARMRLEGIVSKRVDAPYRSGRTGDWVKAKCLGTDEFVVVGYVVSKADPAAVGALVLGYFDSSGCVHAGRVGTGFTHDEARTLQAALRPLEGPRPDMAGRLSRADLAGVRWTAPRLVVAVNYAGWSADNLLRHAVYAGLRQDKAARNVGPPATRA